jgi:ferredoxin
MLLNEMKFLGLKFMAIRWVLTVAAIVVFSWITAKIMKDGDLPDNGARQPGLTIDRNACIGCALCAKNAPELFEIRSRKASLKAYYGEPDAAHLARAVEACPVKAITLAQTEDTNESESPAML